MMERKQREEKIDTPYFKKIVEALENEPIFPVALRPLNYGEQKKRFLHHGDNPNFKYNAISRKNYSSSVRILDSLENDLKSEKNGALKKLYLAKIFELRLHLDLRQAIGNSAKKLFHLSTQLYSKPNSREAKKALEDFQEELELKKIKKEERKKYDAGVIKKAFDRAIKILNIDDWQVLVESQAKTSITINSKHDKGCVVEIPKNREADIYEIEGLVNHEIATHLARGKSGESSKLNLIAFIGADGYAATEEGLATYAEQRLALVREMIPKKAGAKATLSIGATLEGRNFKQTYDFLLSIGFNHRDAWKYTYRVFRGVADTSRVSGILTFDWRYRLGNQQVWELIERCGEKALNRLWVGKIGIQHLDLMKRLNITKPAIARQYVRIEEVLPELC
jgi:hypothetical protein